MRGPASALRDEPDHGDDPADRETELEADPDSDTETEIEDSEGPEGSEGRSESGSRSRGGESRDAARRLSTEIRNGPQERPPRDVGGYPR